MFRFSRRWLEHPGMGVGRPYFVGSRGTQGRNWFRRFLSRRWRNFAKRGAFLKSATLAGYGAMGVVAYALLCCLVHAVHQPSVYAMFHQSAAGIQQDTLQQYRIKRKGARAGEAEIQEEERERIAAEMALEQATASTHAPFKHVLQKDYTLATWEEIEETLREGDIILMRGEGWLSWGIVTTQFAYSFMRPPALYYSHAAVVVKPAEYKRQDEIEAEQQQQQQLGLGKRWLPSMWGKLWGGGGASTRSGTTLGEGRSVEEVLKQESARLNSKKVRVRGAVILECMDNSEFEVEDVHGDTKFFAVQQVEAEKRLTSTRAGYWDKDKAVHGYQYCAVRRLTDQERTPRFKEIIQAYVANNEGRPVEENLFFPLAFFSPRFYLRVNPTKERRGVVSCGEMIAELYEELDLFERHWRWVRLTDADGRSLSPEVDYHRSLASRVRIAVAGIIGPAPPSRTELEAQRQRDQAVREELERLGRPPPTDGDLHPTNAVAVPQLRVYNRFHGRKEEEANHPLTTRERPVAPVYTCIENYQVLADASLQERSVEGCESLSAEARATLLSEINAQRHRRSTSETGVPSVRYGEAVGVEGEEAVKDELSPHSPLAEPLRGLPSGMVVRTRDGGTAQLQHYYAHNPMETMPYTWTHAESERVFDWANAKRQFWAFVRMDSTPEGQWMLKRAAAAAAAASRQRPISATSTTESPLQPDTIVMVDVLDALYGSDEKALAKAKEEREEHPGPRLGPEIRMQRPRSIHFASSLEEEGL